MLLHYLHKNICTYFQSNAFLPPRNNFIFISREKKSLSSNNSKLRLSNTSWYMAQHMYTRHTPVNCNCVSKTISFEYILYNLNLFRISRYKYQMNRSNCMEGMLIPWRLPNVLRALISLQLKETKTYTYNIVVYAYLIDEKEINENF